eukprot:783202-Amorphochlora_amoeboformis.AAC.1
MARIPLQDSRWTFQVFGLWAWPWLKTAPFAPRTRGSYLTLNYLSVNDPELIDINSTSYPRLLSRFVKLAESYGASLSTLDKVDPTYNH